VKNILLQGLNEYRTKKNIQKLKTNIIVGILSFSSNDIIPTDSTDDEIKCFDFYYEKYDKVYINGKLI
jgi:predicted secreted protein